MTESRTNPRKTFVAGRRLYRALSLADFARRRYIGNQGPKRRPLEDRFWEKVEKTEGCWLWTAANGGPGKYGQFAIHAHYHEGAHRVSYVLNVGPIPEGMGVLHRCDVPLCVRPDHLFLGTAADNIADMLAKGRRHSARRVA